VGLDAGVRCRCWEEGKTHPCPFPDHVRIGEDMDMLELDLPRDGNEEAHANFESWRRMACPHENMWFVNEWISNWSGVRIFQQALRAAGDIRFASLLAQIPNINGGRTEPQTAQICLSELDAFESLGPFGRQIWLIDKETGERVQYYVEAYNGVFIHTHLANNDPIEIGLDARGFFIRRAEGEELFRAKGFEQRRRSDKDFEFRDLHSAMSFACRTGIGGVDPLARPSRILAVQEVRDHPDEYGHIIARLRAVFEASARLQHDVVWF
jgi:hypothetical protein